MAKVKDTDRAYADGVKDGFSAGIKASIDLVSKIIEENNAKFEKHSLVNKAALINFSSKLIAELSKLGNYER